MPTGALHSHYWQAERADAPPVTPGASASGGYITWMTPTVIAGSLFGGLQLLYEWTVARWRRGPRV